MCTVRQLSFASWPKDQGGDEDTGSSSIWQGDKCVRADSGRRSSQTIPGPVEDRQLLGCQIELGCEEDINAVGMGVVGVLLEESGGGERTSHSIHRLSACSTRTLEHDNHLETGGQNCRFALFVFFRPQPSSTARCLLNKTKRGPVTQRVQLLGLGDTSRFEDGPRLGGSKGDLSFAYVRGFRPQVRSSFCA